ncbi:hypothetical protein ACFX1R_006680 [Malus domestica]
MARSTRLVIMPTHHQTGSIPMMHSSTESSNRISKKIDLPLPASLLCHGACRTYRHHRDTAVVKFHKLEF